MISERYMVFLKNKIHEALTIEHILQKQNRLRYLVHIMTQIILGTFPLAGANETAFLLLLLLDRISLDIKNIYCNNIIFNKVKLNCNKL